MTEWRRKEQRLCGRRTMRQQPALQPVRVPAGRMGVEVQSGCARSSGCWQHSARQRRNIEAQSISMVAIVVCARPFQIGRMAHMPVLRHTRILHNGARCDHPLGIGFIREAAQIIIRSVGWQWQFTGCAEQQCDMYQHGVGVVLQPCQDADAWANASRSHPFCQIFCPCQYLVIGQWTLQSISLQRMMRAKATCYTAPIIIPM